MKLIHIKDISPFVCFFSIVLLFALLFSTDDAQAAVGSGGAVNGGVKRYQIAREKCTS